MYNVKVIQFPNGTSIIKIYDEIISPPTKKKEKYVKNPFDGTLVKDEGVITDKEDRLKMSLNRTKRAISYYSRSVLWTHWATFTFNAKKIDRCDYELVSRKMRIFLSNMKQKNPDMKYLCVGEKHRDGVSYHFHALLSDIPNAKMTYSGKKDKFGNRIYNLPFKWGFNSVKKISEHDSIHIAKYLSKYLSKEILTLKKHSQRYFVSKGLPKPQIKTMCIPYWELEEEITKIADSLGAVTDVREINGYYSYKEIEIDGGMVN